MNQTKPGGSARQRLGNIAASGLFAFLTLYSVASTAGISNEPLATSVGAPPNIFFIMDDSGSMGRDYMPDDLGGYDDITNINDDYTDGIRAQHKWYYSSAVNTVYFNPDNPYEPPLKADGSGRFPDQDYDNALDNGYAGVNGDRDDLNNFFEHSGWDVEAGGFYYEYDETVDDCSTNKRQNKCYTYHSVNDASAEIKQRFANWYSYYRSRRFAARAGISNAFEAELEDATRLGWGAINVDETKVKGVRAFGDYHENFRDWLYTSTNASGSTPLRQALHDIGTYYESDEPWQADPVAGSGSLASCRQSFAILMTDGVRNEPLNDPVGNADKSSGSSISGDGEFNGESYQYQPRDPFQDSESNTLADVAMDFWKRDLKPGIDNEVPVSRIEEGRDKPFDPAFWQHMVTMPIGLGVTGSVGRDEARDAVFEEKSVAWADVSTVTGKLDDLLHAAMNSRGDFVQADNPKAFEQGLGQLLAAAQAGTGSSTSAAANSAILNADSDRFLASFRAGDWSGKLVSENIETGDEKWNAEEQLADNNARELFTSDGGNGASLAFGTLSNEKQNALNTALDGTSDDLGADRIAWLSGDDDANDAFRDRSPEGKLHLLGDIVNSDPQIERKTNFGHSRLPDGNYNSYRSTATYQDRPDVLYVGANDGYLHAFNANDGEELFAYMPSSLLEPQGGNAYAPINELMNPDYEHRFFVDGTPTIADAYIDNQWRTILVGSMGVGGEQVFALDITEPTTFSEDDILWEFSHADLKRGVDAPQVGRLATGDWAAVFGNGSGANSGTLFVVNLETGSVIETLDGGTGGLATPVFTTNDGIVEYAYAGNMDGELFRFDLSNSNKTQWDSTKLFQTENAAGDAQPITSRPRVANMPQNFNKRVITFGTGSFFRTGDRGDTTVQSLYGIIDEEGSSSGIVRSDLVEQTILGDTTETIDVVQDDGTTVETDFTVRRTSDNPLGSNDEGWVLDLDEVSGERVVSDPTFPSGLDRSRVRFTTLIPNDDPCSSGTTGFIMELGLVAGDNLNEPVFDLSKDEEFDEDDYCTDCGGDGSNEGPPSGTQFGGGEELSTIRDGDRDCIVTSGDMCLRAGDIGVGRQSWKQLR